MLELSFEEYLLRKEDQKFEWIDNEGKTIFRISFKSKKYNGVNQMKPFKTVASLGAAGLITTAITGFIPSASAQTESTPQFQTRFQDLRGHWVQGCAENLARRGIVNGYPDGTFRPNQPITRAEFATLITDAFANRTTQRGEINFEDVPSNFWAQDAIRTAYQKGFLTGYPGQVFRPQETLPRSQAFVALASGMNLSPTQPVGTVLSNTYQDASQIPDYARNQIAAATEQGMVIIRPQASEAPQSLQPNQPATRADVIAAICQARFDTALIPANYIARSGLNQQQGSPSVQPQQVPGQQTQPLQRGEDQIELDIEEQQTAPMPRERPDEFTRPEYDNVFPEQ